MIFHKIICLFNITIRIHMNNGEWLFVMFCNRSIWIIMSLLDKKKIGSTGSNIIIKLKVMERLFQKWHLTRWWLEIIFVSHKIVRTRKIILVTKKLPFEELFKLNIFICSYLIELIFVTWKLWGPSIYLTFNNSLQISKFSIFGADLFSAFLNIQ